MLAAVTPNSPIYFDALALIFKAAKLGSLSKVKEFIQKGGWVNIPNHKGNSMLYYAAKKGQIEVVRYLIANGAHNYRNNKDTSVIDIATSEVRAWLEEQKNGKEVLLRDVIEEKTKTFDTFEASVAFLTSIPELESRKETLDGYATHLAIASPKEAALLPLHFEGQSKIDIISSLIHAFLTCGDIEAAFACVHQLPDTVQEKKLLALQIDAFSKLFEELEKSINHQPDLFVEYITSGLELINIFHKHPQETCDQLKADLCKTASFKAALDYAHANREFGGFVRAILGQSGLEELVMQAKKMAEMTFEKEGQSIMEKVQELLIPASESGDFSVVLTHAKTITDPIFRQIAHLEIAYALCANGQFESAYTLAKSEYENGILFERYPEAIERIVELLNEKSESDWATRFSALM